MSLQAQIEALEELTRLDAYFSKVDKQLGSQRSELGTKKDELAALDAKLTQSRASLDELERLRNELIQEARRMSGQMERSREKLGRSRTEREVNAAQREVEELRKLYRDREIEVERLSTLAESARVENEQTESRRLALAAELGSNENATATQMNELELDAARIAAKRAEVMQRIPRDLLRRYEQVRKRRGDGLAWTHDGTCGICNMRLPPMLFQTLRRRGSFEQCPSCSRLIYFRDAPRLGLESTEEGGTNDET